MHSRCFAHNVDDKKRMHWHVILGISTSSTVDEDMGMGGLGDLLDTGEYLSLDFRYR